MSPAILDSLNCAFEKSISDLHPPFQLQTPRALFRLPKKQARSLTEPAPPARPDSVTTKFRTHPAGRSGIGDRKILASVTNPAKLIQTRRLSKVWLNRTTLELSCHVSWVLGR